MDNCHVISLTYYPKLVAFVWITFFIPGRLAYIYTAPENVAVQHGGSAVLNCSTNASFSVWNFQQVTSTPLNPLCGIQCISYTFPGLSYSCYSPNPTNNTQCNVVVNSASSASAGYYICSDTDHFTKSAMVTVLESGPFCSTSADNTTQVNSSTPVVLGCNASFTATPTLRPNLNWSSEQSYNPPPTSNNTYAYSSAIVTNPVPTIASDTCTLSFSAPPNQPNTNATNAPSYTATCATSVVYPLYCPMNIFISQSEKTLICSAQSNPPASYQWFGPTGSTVISNSSTVEANDAGNYVCVATNSAADCSSSSNFTIDSVFTGSSTMSTASFSSDNKTTTVARKNNSGGGDAGGIVGGTIAAVVVIVAVVVIFIWFRRRSKKCEHSDSSTLKSSHSETNIAGLNENQAKDAPYDGVVYGHIQLDAHVSGLKRRKPVQLLIDDHTAKDIYAVIIRA